MGKRRVAVNDLGRRIGASHPRAKLTDHEVDLVHELLEAGMSYSQVVRKFEGLVSKSTVGRWARGENRAQSCADVRAVETDDAAYDPAHGHHPETGPLRS